jgi:hypothetical protein
MFPSERVAQLDPHSRGFLLIAFYASQGYGGNIVNRLLTDMHIYVYIFAHKVYTVIGDVSDSSSLGHSVCIYI